MAIKELSILIPTYNDLCVDLVQALQQQATLLAIDYEIIVADDGSTCSEVITANRAINQLSHCRLLECQKNSGRAAIRNFLIHQAQYEWLLFIDSDMVVCREDFIQQYINTDGDVIYGGIVVRSVDKHNLRALYEKSREDQHTLERRQQSPYHDFHTANFMVHRDIMQKHPFDERFRYYGYEDVLLGKHLQQDNITIHHIDNPLSFEIYETNEAFVRKTEEGLHTLHQFREELRSYSRLLDFVEQHPVIVMLVRLWHRMTAKWERRHLCGNTPNLTIFSLYRLGYYLTLSQE